MRKIKILGAMGVACSLFTGGLALASSHREAPFITKNPKVDNTDVYAFQSYEAKRIAAAKLPSGTYDPSKAYTTLISDFQPFQDPFGGPNYFPMDDKALYEIHVDNVGDGHEHLTFQFQFTTTLADAKVPVGSKMTSVPLSNIGPITAADMTNQNVSETYTVNLVTGNRRTGSSKPIKNSADQTTTFKKPFDNVGKKTFPNYSAYADTFLYDIDIPGCTAGKGRMFVGQRAEPFAVNLGPIFDLVDAPAAIVAHGEGTTGTTSNRNLIANPLAKKNISTISLEIPSSCLVKDASQPIIGVWSTASVKQARVINPNATYATPAREGGAWTQVSRLGMPLVNEIVIGLKDKDRWNSSEPSADAQFLDYVQYPALPALLEVLFGADGVKAPTAFPRADLVAAFLTGVPKVNMIEGSVPAEYIRLNTALPPTAVGSQNNLGAAACFVFGALKLDNEGCDPAGFPNGRRPGDDVTDVELRVAMGYLLPAANAASGQLQFTDAVLQDESQFDAVFPYIKAPVPGANGAGGF